VSGHDAPVVRGVHGMKRRWADSTVRRGLDRPSAAWFLLPHTCHGLRATLASTVYLALGPAVCDALCEEPCDGRYTAFFRASPELLPAVLVFADAPTGSETLHRYLWLGGRQSSLTAPYTKVERAGRTISLVGAASEVPRVDLAAAAEAERAVERDARPDGWWQHRRPLRRVPATAAHPHGASARATMPINTKLSSFCEALGEHVAAVLFSARASAAPASGWKAS
jgi:hypothetical protein